MDSLTIALTSQLITQNMQTGHNYVAYIMWGIIVIIIPLFSFFGKRILDSSIEKNKTIHDETEKRIQAEREKTKIERDTEINNIQHQIDELKINTENKYQYMEKIFSIEIETVKNYCKNIDDKLTKVLNVK